MKNMFKVLLENIKDKSLMVSFIQFKFKKNQIVEDKENERWRIKEIYLNSITTEDEATIRSSDYRRQRKASDI